MFFLLRVCALNAFWGVHINTSTWICLWVPPSPFAPSHWIPTWRFLLQSQASVNNGEGDWYGGFCCCCCCCSDSITATVWADTFVGDGSWVSRIQTYSGIVMKNLILPSFLPQFNCVIFSSDWHWKGHVVYLNGISIEFGNIQYYLWFGNWEQFTCQPFPQVKEQEAEAETPDPQPSWRLDVNRLSYRINTSHSPIIHGRNLLPQRPGRGLSSFWGGRVNICSCVDQNCDSMGWVFLC